MNPYGDGGDGGVDGDGSESGGGGHGGWSGGGTSPQALTCPLT